MEKRSLAALYDVSLRRSTQTEATIAHSVALLKRVMGLLYLKYPTISDNAGI